MSYGSTYWRRRGYDVDERNELRRPEQQAKGAAGTAPDDENTVINAGGGAARAHVAAVC